jgi:hypothetical protein
MGWSFPQSGDIGVANEQKATLSIEDSTPSNLSSSFSASKSAILTE